MGRGRHSESRSLTGLALICADRFDDSYSPDCSYPSDFGVLAMVGPIIAFTSLFHDLWSDPGRRPQVEGDPGRGQRPVRGQPEHERRVGHPASPDPTVDQLVLRRAANPSPHRGDGCEFYFGGRWLAALCPLEPARRTKKFGALAIIDALSAVGGLAVSLAFALLYHSFWALYAGNFGAALDPHRRLLDCDGLASVTAPF